MTMPALTSMPTVFRILMLCLLMAGVLVKPLVALAGELHEAEHAQLTGDNGHADDSSSDPIDPADAENPWHALMHFSHCCGQAPALMPLISQGSFIPAATDPLPLLSFEFQPPAHPVAFRPPDLGLTLSPALSACCHPESENSPCGCVWRLLPS